MDSISVLKNGRVIKPAHFHEVVYPGVHSDVGGSYAPCEGGKSQTAPEKFGVIPLMHMYQHALHAGVPLLNPGAWNKENRDDFTADPNLKSSYDYYLKTITASGTLGRAITAHMQQFLAWRFRSIHLKQSGDRSESHHIASATATFKRTAAPISSQVAALEKVVDAASMQVSDLESQIREFDMDGKNEFSQKMASSRREELVQAKASYDVARQNMLKEKSRLDALPDMTTFQTLLDLYDRQLMLDVKAIHGVLHTPPGMLFNRHPFTRADLRPHYHALLDAYEAEFVHKKGLTDKTVIHFFDEYIHDSLAGFGSDATLPSDPRVVYLGGDEKFAYASLEREESDRYMA